MQAEIAVVWHLHCLSLEPVALLFALQDLAAGIARQRLAEIKFLLQLVQFFIQLGGGFTQTLQRFFDVGAIGFMHACKQCAPCQQCLFGDAG